MKTPITAHMAANERGKAAPKAGETNCGAISVGHCVRLIGGLQNCVELFVRKVRKVRRASCGRLPLLRVAP